MSGCGQPPTMHMVQPFVSLCRPRHQSHRRLLPNARQSSVSTRSSALSSCNSRLLLLAVSATSTCVPSFDSANNALGASVIWPTDGLFSRTRYSVGCRASSLAPATSSSQVDRLHVEHKPGPATRTLHLAGFETRRCFVWARIPELYGMRNSAS